MINRFYMRGNSWTALRASLHVSVIKVASLVNAIEKSESVTQATIIADEIEAIYNNLADDVIRLSCFEPGLRYWQGKHDVWASTRDESGVAEEITMEDFQELRRQEWAQLSPTNPQPEVPTNEQKESSNHSTANESSSNCSHHS